MPHFLKNLCFSSWSAVGLFAGSGAKHILTIFQKHFWELTSPVGGVRIGSNLQWGWFRLFHQHFCHDIQILPTRDWKSTASQLKCSDSNQPYVRLTGIVIVTKIHHFWSSSPVVVTDDDEEIQSRVSWLKMLCSYVVPAKASKIWGCECFTRMCPAEIFFMKQALPVAVGKTLECFSVCKLQGNLQWYRICADLTWLVEYLLGC